MISKGVLLTVTTHVSMSCEYFLTILLLSLSLITNDQLITTHPNPVIEPYTTLRIRLRKRSEQLRSTSIPGKVVNALWL